MGFDLHGQDAKTKHGEYFRNNVWWWRPLWNYVLHEKLVTEKQAEHGSYNDGYVINRDQAMKIGIKLKHLISQGKTKEYADERKAELDKLEKESCDLCKGTGYRHDNIVDGECNGCGGEGKRDPWEKSYPFSVENVEEFAQFCIESGGFDIC